MAKQVCLLTSFQIAKTQNHIGHQNPKNCFIIILPKAEKPDAKNETPRNRSGQQNRKIDLKSGQN